MPVIEFEGKTTEEAIEKACNQLHLAKDELKFEIITTGSSGIFGLGGKKACIRVTIEEKISTRKMERDSEKPASELKSIEKKPQENNFFEARNFEDRAGRGERQDSRSRSFKPPRKDIEPRRDNYRTTSSRPERKSPRTREEINTEAAATLPATMAAPGENVYVGPEDEIMIQARQSLQNILEHMNIDGRVSVNRIEDRIILYVEGDNSGLLIGKKGATLDALQFLVNKIVNKERGEKYRVIVDTEKYRERRHQSLIDLANRMAEKAKRTRRPVTISQLSAHDRRVVHLALQEKSGLKTRSRGEGPLKNVIIIPGSNRGGSRFNRDSRSYDYREKQNLALAQEAAPFEESVKDFEEDF